MSFGQRLKQLLREKRISQRQLARDLDMAPTTLSGYANDHRELNFFTLIQFADYFQVSVDYLLGCSDDPGRSHASRSRDGEACSGPAGILEGTHADNGASGKRNDG